MQKENTPRKIIITNIVTLNPGDAAILWGTIDILKKAYGNNVEITVFDKFSDTARSYYPWANFRQSFFGSGRSNQLDRILQKLGYGHWSDRIRYARYSLAINLHQSLLSILSRLFITSNELRDLKEYMMADLILSTGGTYLIENYDLSSSIYEFRLCNKTGKPYGFFTQTLGPFTTEKNKKPFKDIFDNAAIILLRDERSKKHVEELGVKNEHIFLGADAAFSLASLSSPDTLAQTCQGKPRLAVSVRSLKFFSSEKETLYYKAIASAVTWAIEKYDAEVTFLSTCQGINEYWVDDSKVATEICKLLTENTRSKVTIDNQFRQPVELVNTYGSFDAVIATRMHAAILSLCAGTPTLGIAYEFKMLELFKNSHMDDLVIDIETLSEKSMTSGVSLLLENLQHNASRVRTVIPKMKTSAENVQEPLRHLI